MNKKENTSKRPNVRHEVVTNWDLITEMLNEGRYKREIYNELISQGKITASERGFYNALNRELDPSTNNSTRSGILRPVTQEDLDKVKGDKPAKKQTTKKPTRKPVVPPKDNKSEFGHTSTELTDEDIDRLV